MNRHGNVRDCASEADHRWEHCNGTSKCGPGPHDFCVWCEAQVACRHV